MDIAGGTKVIRGEENRQNRGEKDGRREDVLRTEAILDM